MAQGAVARIARAHPRAAVAVACPAEFAGLWRTHPGVREVLPLERKGGIRGLFAAAREIARRRFDVGMTLPLSFSSALLLFLGRVPVRVGYAAEGRSFLLTHAVPYGEPRRRHLALEYLRLVEAWDGGDSKEPPPIRIFPSSRDRRRAGELLRARGIRSGAGLLALAPGATYGPTKRWGLDRFRELARRLLASRPETVLVVGGAAEREILWNFAENLPDRYARRVHVLAGETSPETLAALLARCRLLVCNDSGPMHVAAAVGTPVAAVFGSTSPEWTGPLGAGHRVLTRRVPCSPCFRRTCPIGEVCLRLVTVEEVMEAAMKILKRKS